MEIGTTKIHPIKTLSSLILDDELSSIETLSFELKHYCPQVQVIGSSLDPIEGIKKINILNPDIVFLDIVFGYMSGFNLLDQISNRKFDVIFVTAHQQYALKALQYGASGYLLKPIRRIELQETIRRIINSKYNSGLSSQIE